MHMMQAGIVSVKRAWVYPCANCRGWHVTTKASGNHGRASVTPSNPWVAPQFNPGAVQ